MLPGNNGGGVWVRWLLSEISDVDTKAHNDASNRSVDANIGAFLSF